MAILTEKEVTLNHGLATISLYAEYEDGKATEVYALLDVDGYRLGNSPGVMVYNDLKGKTNLYTGFVQMLDDSLGLDFMNAINKLIKG